MDSFNKTILHHASMCSVMYGWIGEASRYGFTAIASILATISIALAICILGRLRMRSGTEDVLLATAIAQVNLPVLHLARYLGGFFGDSVEELLYLRIWLSYLWMYFYIAANLLTLVLAARRYVAVEYPHKYAIVCSRQNTIRIVFAVYIFSAVILSPTLSYRKPNLKEYSTTIRPPNNVIEASNTMASAVLQGKDSLKITFWIFIFVFQVLSPTVLAILSLKFARALCRRMSSKNEMKCNLELARANQKTKLILTVSLLALTHELPLGILSMFHLFSSSSPTCLTALRQLTKELTIAFSAMNLFVYYYTNQKFKEEFSRFFAFASSNGKDHEAGTLSCT